MENFTIENFRSIKDKLAIDLSHINIITGANNSGKSNVLKILSLFSDYLNSENHFELSFNGLNSEKHKIDSYQNCINWENWGKNNLFEFSYKRGNYEVGFSFSPNYNNEDLFQKGKLINFQFKNLKTSSKLQIINTTDENYILKADPSIITDLWLSKDLDEDDKSTKEKYQKMIVLYKKLIIDNFIRIKELEVDSKEFWDQIWSLGLKSESLASNQYKLDEYKQGNLKPKESKTLKIDFSLKKELNDLSLKKIVTVIRVLLNDYFTDKLKKNQNNNEPVNVHNELVKLQRIIESFINISLSHINPDRSNQARIYLHSGSINEINRIINSYNTKPMKKGGVGDKFLIKWMTKFNLGNDYRFRNIEGISTAVEIKGDFGWKNIVDKGFGVGQLFTVFFKIAEYLEVSDQTSNKNHSDSRFFPHIIMIEEPEANLHPKFQSLLADVFYDAITSRKIQFIIETHSEYLIRRFQYLVASDNNDLINTDIKIYYFNDVVNMDNGEKIFDLEMRPDGMLKKDFGPGFFDEATQLTIDLLKQQKCD